MKILYLFDKPLVPESVTLLQVKSMCKAMAQLNHQVFLSIPASSQSDNGGTIDHDGYTICLRPYQSSKLIKYFSAHGVRKAVNRINPDLVYLRTPLLLNQIYGLTVPRIIELHNTRMHLGSNLLNDLWVRFLMRESRKECTKRVVCISQALGQYWSSMGIDEHKILSYHDGVDSDTYIQIHDSAAARAKLGMPQDRIIVSYIGGLYKDRKIEYIVRLAQDYPRLYFVVAGGPESQKNHYMSMTINLGLENIRFEGKVPHALTNLYQYASDILLAIWSSEVPTINYCSPLKIFEYMASGRIIVAQGYPTIKEVLRDRENSILVHPDSYESLKEGIDRALQENDQSLIGANARNEVLSKYTWRKRVECILADL